MLIQRSIPIILEKSCDFIQTIKEFNRYQKEISPDCFSEGFPKNTLSLHKSVYHTIESSLTSQLKCTAIRPAARAFVFDW